MKFRVDYYENKLLTNQTAKYLANFSGCLPNTEMRLELLNETFNIADFCELIKKGYFRSIYIGISKNVSVLYENNFNNAIQELKQTWTSPTSFPQITINLW